MTADAHPSGPELPSRTPTGVRAALSGQDRAEFEHDYQVALDRAGAEFDLTPVHDVLDHWWQQAVLAADRPAHQRMLAAAAALRDGRSVPSDGQRQVPAGRAVPGRLDRPLQRPRGTRLIGSS